MIRGYTVNLPMLFHFNRELQRQADNIIGFCRSHLHVLNLLLLPLDEPTWRCRQNRFIGALRIQEPAFIFFFFLTCRFQRLIPLDNVSLGTARINNKFQQAIGGSKEI